MWNEESEKKAKEALEMFKSMFRSVKIEKGASLTFSTNESGTLTTIERKEDRVDC